MSLNCECEDAEGSSGPDGTHCPRPGRGGRKGRGGQHSRLWREPWRLPDGRASCQLLAFFRSLRHLCLREEAQRVSLLIQAVPLQPIPSRPSWRPLEFP